MTYTGTHERLFHEKFDPASLFEKEASISRMPDDEKKWPAHLLSEIHKALPFLSSFDVDLALDRQDPEAGYALGYAMIRNKSMRNMPQDDVGKAKNRLRIPIIVEDRQLQPFHTFELGGNVYPLTAERVEAAMVNPAMFDGSVSKMPLSRSLVDQLSPPYQQRQGFGRIAEPNATGLAGIGKSAAAEDAPNYRMSTGTTSCGGCKYFNPSDGGGQGRCSKFDFNALATHTCDAWVSRSPKDEAAKMGSVKEASLRSRRVPMSVGEFGDSWLKKFEGTPFLEEAYALQSKEAMEEADRAKAAIASAQARAADAEFDIKLASLEGDLAKWRMMQAGVPMTDTLGKLASCRNQCGLWSDEFLGSPFHKQAMSLEVESSRREIDSAARIAEEERGYGGYHVRRMREAELELKLAEWRQQSLYGGEKAAAVSLSFQNGISGTTVFPALKNPPKFMGVVSPSDFTFYPLQGTNFYMGVHSSYKKSLEGSDQAKIRAALAEPMRAEMMAARGNQPSPGKFILVVKRGQGYEYVKPQLSGALPQAKVAATLLELGIGGAAALGGGLLAAKGIHSALRKRKEEFAHRAKVEEEHQKMLKNDPEYRQFYEEHGLLDTPTKKVAGTPFLKQDRPEKVKSIYKALKREHPTMPAEKKARIAARQGKPGHQKQGPPYAAPIKEGELIGMTYDPKNANILELQKQHGANWKSVLAKQRGISEGNIQPIKAAGLDAVTGTSLGYLAGSHTAAGTAKAVAPEGRKEQAVAIARKLAVVGVTLGAVIGAIAGKKALTPLIKKALESLDRSELQFLVGAAAAAAGGVAGGVASGALTGTGAGLRERLQAKREKLDETRGQPK